MRESNTSTEHHSRYPMGFDNPLLHPNGCNLVENHPRTVDKKLKIWLDKIGGETLAASVFRLRK
jgi:hypothetical protein